MDDPLCLIIEDLDPLITSNLEPSSLRALYRANKRYEKLLKQSVMEINKLKLIDWDMMLRLKDKSLQSGTDMMSSIGGCVHRPLYIKERGIRPVYGETNMYCMGHPHELIELTERIEQDMHASSALGGLTIGVIWNKLLSSMIKKSFCRGYLWSSNYILRRWDISNHTKTVITAAAFQESLVFFRAVLKKIPLDELTVYVLWEGAFINRIICGGNVEIVQYWIQMMKESGKEFVIDNVHFLTAIANGKTDVFKYLVNLAEEAGVFFDIHQVRSDTYDFPLLVAFKTCPDESLPKYLIELGESGRYGDRFFIGDYAYWIISDAEPYNRRKQYEYIISLFEYMGYEIGAEIIVKILRKYTDYNSLKENANCDVLTENLRNRILAMFPDHKNSDTYTDSSIQAIYEEHRSRVWDDMMRIAVRQHHIPYLLNKGAIGLSDLDCIFRYITEENLIEEVHSLCSNWTMAKLLAKDQVVPLCKAFELACRNRITYMAEVILKYIIQIASDYLVYPVISDQLLVDCCKANDVATVRLLLERLGTPKRNYIGNYLYAIPFVAYFASSFSICKGFDLSILIQCKSLADETGFQEMSSLIEPYI